MTWDGDRRTAVVDGEVFPGEPEMRLQQVDGRWQWTVRALAVPLPPCPAKPAIQAAHAKWCHMRTRYGVLADAMNRSPN